MVDSRTTLMEFEWDAAKARANLKRHGVRFEEAKTVFNDPLTLTFPDFEHSETEDRCITLGGLQQAVGSCSSFIPTGGTESASSALAQ